RAEAGDRRCNYRIEFWQKIDAHESRLALQECERKRDWCAGDEIVRRLLREYAWHAKTEYIADVFGRHMHPVRYAQTKTRHDDCDTEHRAMPRSSQWQEACENAD